MKVFMFIMWLLALIMYPPLAILILVIVGAGKLILG